MKLLLAKLCCAVVLGGLVATEANAQTAGQLTPAPGAAAPGTPPEPQKDTSLVGLWKGKLTVAGSVAKMAVQFRADGTYTATMENGNHVASESGTYTFKNGILETSPEGGVIIQFKVTFHSEDEATFKGGGVSMTMKR